jgi:hypothetical protein
VPEFRCLCHHPPLSLPEINQTVMLLSSCLEVVLWVSVNSAHGRHGIVALLWPHLQCAAQTFSAVPHLYRT